MSDFEIVRSTHIDADPGRVHDLVSDFRQWPDWSPWEDLDPAMQREYDGPADGVGSTYSWSGNRKAGAGSMQITESSPERVGIRLTFLKPWKATNQVTFDLVPADAGTDVSWRMNGEQTGMAAVFGRLFPMDRLVGKDFEKGLARLKRVAES
ncbi:MAG: SRPBCC family protein [Nocardioidaceae bacterium]